MSYFKNPDFTQARSTVVGRINTLTVDQRWELETTLFVDAILKYMPPGRCATLDYGCGIGRVSKELLRRHPECTIVGVDNSEVQLAHATEYIQDSRFKGALPHEVEGRFDFAFSLYVLQHVRAIHLRQALQIIHANLAPKGLFIHCGSAHRMAVRDDAARFCNDSFLGVDVLDEISLLFEPVGNLFSEEDFEREPVLRKIVLGQTGEEEPDTTEVLGEPHPAKVFRRRDIKVPYWRLPMP